MPVDRLDEIERISPVELKEFVFGDLSLLRIIRLVRQSRAGTRKGNDRQEGRRQEQGR